MRNSKNYIGAALLLMLLVACGENTRNEASKKQEIPKALQDDPLAISSYERSGGDLVEALYQELVDKTPQLKKLEEDMAAQVSRSNDLKNKLHKYDSKSNNYYSIATSQATAIADSVLRAKILALITASNSKYNTKTAELNVLLDRISKNDTNLKDHHQVLKIVLTLPIIEKYQDESKPNKKELQDLIGEQEKLILKTDSLTPKY